MPIVVQIRNVPASLHRRLKARAARAGISLSDYLLAEIKDVGARPTLEEMRARLQRRPPARLSVEPAHAIRDERGDIS